MSAVILLACVLLLVGHGASSEAGVKMACPQPNGLFPIRNNCSLYIECINGIASGPFSCPGDQIFNPDKTFCEDIATTAYVCPGSSWELNNSTIGNPQLSLSVKCPDPPAKTCKDVKAVENRTVVTLSDGLEVLCDTKTDGGGWIVFQRRLSSDVDFYRNWIDYKYGFGDIRGNFWMGNEKIHRLTNLRRYELRVDFTFKGKSYFAQYSKFRIFGEAEKYQLEVEGYSGNAGDSLDCDSGMAFSTKDRDNDKYDHHCATLNGGAWWYNNCYCSNLNGRWGSEYRQDAMTWFYTTGHSKSATSTEMKIRALD